MFFIEDDMEEKNTHGYDLKYLSDIIDQDVIAEYDASLREEEGIPVEEYCVDELDSYSGFAVYYLQAPSVVFCEDYFSVDWSELDQFHPPAKEEAWARAMEEIRGEVLGEGGEMEKTDWQRGFDSARDTNGKANFEGGIYATGLYAGGENWDPEMGFAICVMVIDGRGVGCVNGEGGGRS